MEQLCPILSIYMDLFVLLCVLCCLYLTSMSSPKVIFMRQIEHLFLMMDMFVEKKVPLSVKQIVERFGWPRSTVFNMVNTLVNKGYLFQPIARGGYFPTNKWLSIGQIFVDALPIPANVHDFLVGLQSVLGETILLLALDKEQAVIMDMVESKEAIRYSPKIGDKIPLATTAAGKVLISQLSILERQQIIPSNQKQTEFNSQVELLERQGWLASIGHYAKDLGGVAVSFPIYGRRNAIALGGPANRVGAKVEEFGFFMAKEAKNFLQNIDG